MRFYIPICLGEFLPPCPGEFGVRVTGEVAGVQTPEVFLIEWLPVTKQAEAVCKTNN